MLFQKLTFSCVKFVSEHIESKSVSEHIESKFSAIYLYPEETMEPKWDWSLSDWSPMARVDKNGSRSSHLDSHTGFHMAGGGRGLAG